MPVFLSDEWIDAMGAAVAATEVDPGAAVAVRQVVGDVSWTVRVAGGRVSIDRRPEADVTFTTDQATAAALARGELATQDAFAAGRLRIGGDLVALVAAGGALAGIDEAYANVRAATTY